MKSLSINRNAAKGFSLIELLLVLGVLAILLVAAFVVYPQVRDRNQANAEVSNLTAIKANINNLYASRGGNYAGLDDSVAIQAKAYPSSMVNGSAAAAAWGGAVTTDVNASATTLADTPAGAIQANRSFTVSYTGVPAGVCLGLVSGAARQFQGIKVGATQVLDSSGNFDPAAAAGVCTGTTDITFFSN